MFMKSVDGQLISYIGVLRGFDLMRFTVLHSALHFYSYSSQDKKYDYATDDDNTALLISFSMHLKITQFTLVNCRSLHVHLRATSARVAKATRQRACI
jgi:hypothetical protein